MRGNLAKVGQIGGKLDKMPVTVGIAGKVPSSARKEPRSKDLGFFVPRRPWTQVQGLLAVNCSSVGSAGKRSTGPFSESLALAS